MAKDHPPNLRFADSCYGYKNMQYDLNEITAILQSIERQKQAENKTLWSITKTSLLGKTLNNYLFLLPYFALLMLFTNIFMLLFFHNTWIPKFLLLLFCILLLASTSIQAIINVSKKIIKADNWFFQRETKQLPLRIDFINSLMIYSADSLNATANQLEHDLQQDNKKDLIFIIGKHKQYGLLINVAILAFLLYAALNQANSWQWLENNNILIVISLIIAIILLITKDEAFEAEKYIFLLRQAAKQKEKSSQSSEQTKSTIENHFHSTKHLKLVSACLAGLPCNYQGKASPCKKVIDLVINGEAIPICPEQLGGLNTPREPAEQQGDKIVTINSKDVTKQFHTGATEALKFAQQFNCREAILKARSPSCGSNKIYDGTFSKKIITGDGVLTKLLKQHAIKVTSEEDL